MTLYSSFVGATSLRNNIQLIKAQIGYPSVWGWCAPADMEKDDIFPHEVIRIGIEYDI
jgi:hypothetical protein